MFTLVTKEYETVYLEGWDSRMADLFVNPYIMDFDTVKYQAWKDGWGDADIALEEENGL